MEALEAAGDCQSGFARPGCVVAGIKGLAGQPLLQSWAEWIRVEAGNSQGPALQLQAKQGPMRRWRSRSSSAGGPLHSWEWMSGLRTWDTETTGC